MDSEQLWRAVAAGDAAARERLLTEHLSLVHHVARQLSRSLVVQADFEELVSCGTMGLMNALEAFEPDRGLAFSTFAVPRIRGAILDELRRQDHVPRSVRRKTREIAQARESLGRIFGRPASDKEVAEHLGVDLETFWRWEADSEGAVHLSLDHGPDDPDGQGALPPEALSTEPIHGSVEDRLTREQEAQLLQRALLKLKEQERIVLTLYYFEELKLHEIADVLELTESRVSQIRAKALGKLRTDLSAFRTVR